MGREGLFFQFLELLPDCLHHHTTFNPSRLPEEIGLDKGIQPTVEHRINIAFLGVGAMILDQPIGLQHVGANLTAPGDILLVALDVLLIATLFSSSSRSKSRAMSIFMAMSLLRC